MPNQECEKLRLREGICVQDKPFSSFGLGTEGLCAKCRSREGITQVKNRENFTFQKPRRQRSGEVGAWLPLDTMLHAFLLPLLCHLPASQFSPHNRQVGPKHPCGCTHLLECIHCIVPRNSPKHAPAGKHLAASLNLMDALVSRHFSIALASIAVTTWKTARLVKRGGVR